MTEREVNPMGLAAQCVASLFSYLEMKSRLRCEPGAAGCFARRRLVDIYWSVGDRSELDWRRSLLLGEAALNHEVAGNDDAWSGESRYQENY